jgi:excisionase family DNA binding protein
MTEADDPFDGSRLLKASEVAVFFGVNPKTVYAWIKQGRMPHVRTPLGGIRVEAAQVAALVAASREEKSDTP